MLRSRLEWSVADAEAKKPRSTHRNSCNRTFGAKEGAVSVPNAKRMAWPGLLALGVLVVGLAVVSVTFAVLVPGPPASRYPVSLTPVARPLPASSAHDPG